MVKIYVVHSTCRVTRLGALAGFDRRVKVKRGDTPSIIESTFLAIGFVIVGSFGLETCFSHFLELVYSKAMRQRLLCRSGP